VDLQRAVERKLKTFGEQLNARRQNPDSGPVGIPTFACGQRLKSFQEAEDQGWAAQYHWNIARTARSRPPRRGIVIAGGRRREL
jgi:hypothetical protein